ncbi:MAG: metallopeptidase TldD-related protein [Phytoplasma sp.]|uniref:TldD/PmbA family protein n=1 Tax=Phytoplasma sp. TaxID=2155 RepID=UPI002B40323A|nr:metallopeptidase TldD-related protein [Phytoplasma sp.]WRH06843.1 MAG: metallopeptidase TldD-related protein [Phytoplasma sp.]
MMSSNNINYNKWFKTALNQGFQALEILTNENTSMSIALEDGKIHEHVKSDMCVFTIKGLYQNKKSSMYLEKIDETKMIETLQLLKNQISCLNFKEKDFIFEGSSVYPDVVNSNFNFTTIDIQKKYDLLFRLEKELSKSLWLNKIEHMSYSESFIKHKIVNSKGLNLEEESSSLTFYVYCVFKKNKEIQDISESFTVKNFDQINISKYAQKIIFLGEKKLTTQSLTSQVYPTVLSNKIFAKFLNSFSNIFSGIYAYRNLTKLKDKKGQQIASSKVTLIDEPLCDTAFFKYKFDEEGVPCSTKKIIDKGIFKQFIHNLKTSFIFNTKPTGNSFYNSIAMTNCYLKEGQKSFEDMILPIQTGVYIDYLIGLHAGINDVSGDFSVQASGFKIEQGKITTPVKMLVISGNFFDILLNLKDIANDLLFQTSGFGSPSVYVGDLTVAGAN